MRILYGSRFYTNHDLNFISAMVAAGHTLAYVQLEPATRALESRPLPSSVERFVLGVDSAHCLSKMSVYEKLIHQIKPDLIQAGPLQSLAYMTALSGLAPLVAMTWGYDVLIDAKRDAHQAWISRYTLQQARAVISDCQPVSQALQAIEPQVGSKLLEIPFGTDVTTFAPQPRHNSRLRQQLGWQNNRVVISLRSFEPMYGVDLLLQAFAVAVKSNPQLRLLLVGGGSQEAMLLELIQSLQIQSYVHVAGRVVHDDLPAYLNSADIYMSCAFSDGTSVSLLEAMACELAVLVADNPSNRQWVHASQHGELARLHDLHDNAAKLLQLSQLTDEQLQTLGRANRNVILQKANWQSNIKALLQQYQQLIAD